MAARGYLPPGASVCVVASPPPHIRSAINISTLTTKALVLTVYTVNSNSTALINRLTCSAVQTPIRQKRQLFRSLYFRPPRMPPLHSAAWGACPHLSPSLSLLAATHETFLKQPSEFPCVSHALIYYPTRVHPYINAGDKGYGAVALNSGRNIFLANIM